MKTQGAHISDFEKSKEQLAYEQASQQWMQMAQLALSKGQPWNNPQPTPQQFGYLQQGEVAPEKPDALTGFLQTLQSQAQSDVGNVQPGAQ